MKKFVVVLFAVALVFSASLVSAEGLYVSGDIGATLTNDTSLTVSGINAVDLEFETGLAFRGAVGYDLGNNARVEGELSYRSADIDKVTVPLLGMSADPSGEVNVLSFLLNGYYDIAVDAPVTPFITGGIGYANVEIDDGDTAEDDSVFAYQVGVGLGYALNEQTTIDCGYRYMGTSDLEFDIDGIATEAEYSSHNFYVGARFAIQ